VDGGLDGELLRMNSSVPAVSRALLILRTVAALPDDPSLADLTKLLKLPKSSVRSICLTLIENRFLRLNKAGRYQLDVAIFDISNALLNKSSLVTHFSEAWDSLAGPVDGTIVLVTLDRFDVIYIAYHAGIRDLHFNYRIGLRLPASVTAGGKAILATLPADELRTLLDTHTLQSVSANSLTDKNELLAQLRATDQTGYSYDDQEAFPGICCVAAPIFEAGRSEACAAVSMGMPESDFKSSKRESAVALIKSLAGDISKRLGSNRQA
jgi:DNA-binding IclR family transcriptional regulator